jgi:imidazolonepropionase-like amidohydrolase
VDLVNWGVQPLDAIRMATINASELLGTSDKVGTLEAGKYADMVAISGDPLSDIHVMRNVVFVMKGGEVWKNSR